MSIDVLGVCTIIVGVALVMKVAVVIATEGLFAMAVPDILVEMSFVLPMSRMLEAVLGSSRVACGTTVMVICGA